MSISDIHDSPSPWDATISWNWKRKSSNITINKTICDKYMYNKNYISNYIQFGFLFCKSKMFPRVFVCVCSANPQTHELRSFQEPNVTFPGIPITISHSLQSLLLVHSISLHSEQQFFQKLFYSCLLGFHCPYESFRVNLPITIPTLFLNKQAELTVHWLIPVWNIGRIYQFLLWLANQSTTFVPLIS